MTRRASWASSPAARKKMQANKSRDTGPELALRRELHRRGFRYFVNRRPLPDLRRTADLVFPRQKVAVFVDGCFWHGCPEHHTQAALMRKYWASKVLKNRERDTHTNEALAKSGWTAIRIWEHEAPQQAADKVADALRRGRWTGNSAFRAGPRLGLDPLVRAAVSQACPCESLSSVCDTQEAISRTAQWPAT